MSDPKKYSVRALAASNGLSLKRVDAILRLKGLEEHWKQVSMHHQYLGSCVVGLRDDRISISL